MLRKDAACSKGNVGGSSHVGGVLALAQQKGARWAPFQHDHARNILVAVVFRFERAVHRDADVIGLFLAQFGQFDADLLEV